MRFFVLVAVGEAALAAFDWMEVMKNVDRNDTLEAADRVIVLVVVWGDVVDNVEKLHCGKVC